MPYESPEFQPAHQPHYEEVIQPQDPRKEGRWERYSLGFGVGLAVIVALVRGGGLGLPGALFTLGCMFFAIPLTIVGVVQLSGKSSKQTGWIGPVLWTAIATYGWFAILVAIGQTFWGWNVF